MSANFTPDMTGYKGLSPFRFWCQKTLPLVYDDSLSYYELLCKVVSYINNLITDVAAAEENVDKLLTAYNQLQEYVNEYFDGADFQQKIDDSLDRYAEDGTLSSMVNRHVSALLPHEVGQQIGPVVDEDLGPVVDLKLPAVVESKIAAPVAAQLPAVVQTQIGGVVGNQIGDVVADQIDEVVADQITDAVSPLVHDEVAGLIRPAVSTELPAALQVYLPPEVQAQLPGAIGTDLESIAPPVIKDWLDAHPEATTSVPDGSISFSKLATDLQRRAGIVGTYFPSDFTNEYVWQVNQYAVYQGIVYRCIKTTTVGQAWNASEWTTANMNSDLFYMWWCLNYLSQSITTIDSSPATSAHEAGEYFIYYDGAHLYRLAKASSNIAVGDTLTANGNFIYSSVANMIADLKVEIADLKSAIPSGIIYTARMAKSGNLFPFREDVIDGKYYSISNGELVTQKNANFYGFILAVNPNTEYRCTFARFLCLLDANKLPIAEMQTSTTIINTENAVFVAVSFDKTTYPIESYGISLGYITDRTDYKIELPWLFSDSNIYKMLPNGISVEAENPAANSTLIACDYSNNVKYNKSYIYMAKFTGEIGNITIYHGSGTYGTYIRVTPTNIIINTSGIDIYNDAHELTIADYLYIFVDTDDQNGAVIRVMSNGKLVTVNVTNWEGWQGQIFALTASALTYHRLDILFKDSNKSIWVFGDSYLSKTSNERWSYYLKQWGVDKYMAVGYPGAGSSNIYPSLENMLNITQPKFIVWALGMNDPDTSEAINENWLNAINKITTLCKKYNITLILAKIPNVNGAGTLYNHSFKNAWIEASGYRFIDVPFAVGADASGNWYNDLLASDGVHPTWRGAEAIAYQYLTDAPELLLAE